VTTDRKSFLRTLAGETCTPPPIWLMRQAGRYLAEYRKIRAEVGGFLDLCYSPEHATEVTLQPIRRFGFDAAILFSDILVVPHGLGQKVWFVEGEGPKLSPIRSAADMSGLSLTGMQSTSGLLEPVYEAVGRIREAAISTRSSLGR
jgi:uroporphyrinogen decarboxylase